MYCSYLYDQKVWSNLSLSLLYMLYFGLICQKCNVVYHCHADDIQLYLPLRYNNESNISTLFECLDEIRAWMASIFLQLNESKSEVVILHVPTSQITV